ncbi:Gfo/Idh/MocA family protein [Paenibacillus agaridevorans]|uniref:Gfo/Idh/MocA family protein n=1 Tax=Paenibacillus agaridevorans TaxID=171404 RepID=UPI001BE49DF5|nr:Gfo/Idh/MocA family oxidoreductase [Paenibacillus agaridevorans]
MSIRIGILGAGSIARSHIRALSKIEEAEVVSVYDINGEAAVLAAEEAGATVAESPDQLLNNQQIDAVFICVPQFARGDLEEMAVQRGIHLFVEKPLGLDLDIALEKARLIEQSGLINAAGYCLRYYDTVQTARRYLQGKRIHLIQAHRFGTSHPGKWWWQLKQSGGHLVDAVTHQVDMIRYLAGELAEVHAHFGRASLTETAPESTIYDAGAISFATASGAVGSVTESCVSPYHRGSEIKLFGADFFVHIVNNKTITIIDAERNETLTSDQNAMYMQDRAFVEAVKNGRQELVCSSYADGVRTLAFTLAANQSAVEKRTISLQAGEVQM